MQPDYGKPCAHAFRAAPEHDLALQSQIRPRNQPRVPSNCGTRVERPPGLRILWEPRGAWPAELVLDLCRELKLVHVVDPFVDTTTTPEQTYLRLHGLTGARHVYTEEELAAIAASLPNTGTAYVMFNNLPRIGDARRFLASISSSATLQRWPR